MMPRLLKLFRLSWGLLLTGRSTYRQDLHKNLREAEAAFTAQQALKATLAGTATAESTGRPSRRRRRVRRRIRRPVGTWLNTTTSVTFLGTCQGHGRPPCGRALTRFGVHGGSSAHRVMRLRMKCNTG